MESKIVTDIFVLGLAYALVDTISSVFGNKSEKLGPRSLNRL